MYAFYKEENIPSTSNRQTQATAGNAPSPTTAPRPPHTADQYLDRITIAGLHNFLNATELYEKVMWIVTFIVAIIGTMFYLVPTIRQYLEYTIVLDIQYRIEPGVRLPPVWVCTPGINFSFIDEQIDSVRSYLLVDKRIRVFGERFAKEWRRKNGPLPSTYQRYNAKTETYDTVQSRWNSTTMAWEWNPDDLVDIFIIQAKTFAASSMRLPELEYDRRLLGPQIIVEMISIAIEAMGTDWVGYKAFFEEGMFHCESFVQNCSLNGIPFDCCRRDPMGFSRAFSKCFKLDLPKEASALRLHPNETSQFQLSFETTIDSTYLGVFGLREAENGDVSFGSRMSTFFDYKEPLGIGSITTITVRAIKKSKLSNCTERFRLDPRLHKNSHPIIRDYFEEMTNPDQYSVGTCEFGKLLEALYVQCGCVLFYDTMRPQNDSIICRPQHISTCIIGALPDVVSTEDIGSALVKNSTLSAAKSNSTSGEARAAAKPDLYRIVNDVASKECLPLCDSWTYDFVSSSMASEGRAGDVSRYFRTKAVIIFDPEYRVETEVYKIDYSALIASLGDGFGLILGISAVTLIQIPIWTVAAGVVKRKLSKITPLVKVRQQQNTSV